MKDKQFFLLAIALENATQRQLDLLTKSIDKIFRKYTRNGVVTDPAAMASKINKEIDAFYDLFVEHLQISSQRVGKLRAQQAIDEVVPKLRKAGLVTESLDLYRKVRSYADDVGTRIMVDKWAGQPLGYRIKTIREGTQKTVLNIIENGVKEQLSAKNIAKNIEQYVNPLPGAPKTAPLDEFRKRFGRPKSFTPEGVPQGSVQYNAMRIARTETAHIYRQATLDFYKNREWVTGYRWVLSNSHPRPDICDDYANVKYTNANDVPTGHPHCLCDVQPELMSAEEMRNLVKDRNAELARATSK